MKYLLILALFLVSCGGPIDTTQVQNCYRLCAAEGNGQVLEMQNKCGELCITTCTCQNGVKFRI